uniref:M60 family metallopeptidase n=1 Tax=Scandinavium goeteborgense TaxID=1851514 RepID=UPI001357FEDC|nr:M60 family metallopeptidase [Scandinavium goeteborgense]
MQLLKYGCLALAIGSALAPLYVTASSVTPTAALVGSYALNHDIIPARQFTLDQPGTPGGLRAMQLRGYDQTPLQSTGYWVKKGDVLYIEVNYPDTNTPPSIEAFISVPHDRTHKYQHALRQKLMPGANTVQIDRDGIVYIANFGNPLSGDIRIDLQGGKPFPRFILNQNQPSDWQRMLADAEMTNSPYVELLSDRMMITLRRDMALQHIERGNPVSMLETWDKIVNAAEDQYGLTESDRRSKHQRIPHRFHFIDGIPPAGIVNNDTCFGALNAWTWRLQSCSDSAIKAVVNNPTLQHSGWGPWHELGHHFQLQPHTWNNMGEVVVNLTSLYVQRELGNASNMETTKTWDKAFKYLNQPQRDYHNQDLFVKVAMLWQLDLTFGKDFYAKLAHAYREFSVQPTNDPAKIQRFILESSRVAGYNLIPFFEKWGLATDENTRQLLAGLDLPWMDDPIWENRDTNIKYDYSNLQVEAPVAVAGSNFTVTSGTDASNAYELDGSGSQRAESYQWTILRGAGTFWLQEKPATPWVRVVNSAKARALIPANTQGQVTYLLTVTNKEGRKASSEITVTVEKSAQVNHDSAFVNAAKLSITPTDTDKLMSFSGIVTSNTTPTSSPVYRWILPSGVQDGNEGQSQNFSIAKTDQMQTLLVSVDVSAGAIKRTLTQTIQVKPLDSSVVPPVRPDYKEGTPYSAGDVVTNKGNLYQCKPWPYTGWCAGAAWAYAPGVGQHWQQAWDSYQK